MTRAANQVDYERLGREVGESLAGGVLAEVKADGDVITIDGSRIVFRTPGLPVAMIASVLDFAIRKNLARRAVEKIAVLEAEIAASGVNRARVLSWRNGAVEGLRDALATLELKGTR